MPSQSGTIDNDALAQALFLCAQGDRSGFNLIYTSTIDVMMGLARARMPNEDAAKDAVQMSYLAIWKNAASFDAAKGKAFTWMIVILRHKCIDILRAETKHLCKDVLTDTIEDDAPLPDNAAKAYLWRRKLAPALADLPSTMKEAILLNVVHGFTSREVGLSLDVPHNTAKSWIRRGLARLRNNLEYQSLGEIL